MENSELNDLVAEKVMGWNPHGRAGRYYYDTAENLFRRFSPAQRMGDAWRVVEKIREQGWLFTISEGRKENGVEWIVMFHKLHGDSVFIASDDLCQGICRAALKVVE